MRTICGYAAVADGGAGGGGAGFAELPACPLAEAASSTAVMVRRRMEKEGRIRISFPERGRDSSRSTGAPFKTG
jgi:hypothetical protein